jgi:glycosyltransferase involved in cell wall biosynthesis
VARLEPPAKGHDLLFETLALSHWRNRPVEINLYGGGGAVESLRRMAARFELKNVNFRGHLSDVRKIWAQNHLLIMPSRFEGLPLAIVEAMFCARPAVVTDVGGNAEICVDGQTGFVAEGASVGPFDRALERAWNARDQLKGMGQEALARAQKLIPKDPIGEFCSKLIDCTRD